MDYGLLILVGIVLLAYMLNATAGFGGSIVTLTLGAHLYSVDFLVPVAALLNLSISVYLVARYRADVDLRLLLRKIAPAALAGMPVGILLFYYVKTDILKTALGVFVICFSALELILMLRLDQGEKRKPLSEAQSSLLLFGGGVMHGMYAIGGPLLVFYAGRNIPGKTAVRSTLSALWIALNGVLLVTHLSTGMITPRVAWYFALLLPAMAAGIAAGELLHRRMPERGFRALIFSMLIVAGVSLLV